MPSELSVNLDVAFSRVWKKLQSDPAELARRLARLGRPTASRIPRACCLTLRAGDARLPFSPGAGCGQWTVRKPDLQELTGPVSLTGGELVADAARKLGVSP